MFHVKHRKGKFMATTYQLRKLHRRAETLQRNARSLMSDLMDIEGRDPKSGEVFASDYADNALCSSEELCNFLEKWIEQTRDPRGARKQ